VVADCPEELSRIVEKMLAKKVDDRYQSMDEVLRDLEPSLEIGPAVPPWSDCLRIPSNCLPPTTCKERKRSAQGAADRRGKHAGKEFVGKGFFGTSPQPAFAQVERTSGARRTLLRTGKLQEARSEVDAASDWTRRHEPAKQLFAELEAAAARAQDVEQKLRLTKQKIGGRSAHRSSHSAGASTGYGRREFTRAGTAPSIEVERNRREKRQEVE